MPKAIIDAMRRSLSKKGVTGEEADHRIYGHLNNEGYMRGSRETAKGKEADIRAAAKRKATR